MAVPNRARVRLGGWSLVAATILFTAVFSYLAAAFGYPDVLDRPASEVLPALLDLGGTGRGVWLLYGLIPLLLIPAARGVDEAARATAPRLGRAALWFAVLSAAAMMIGLLRWPTLQWTLARQWPSASEIAREAITSRFDTANLYLGNVVGEFLGELFLNGFFLVSSLALAARQPRRHWLAFAGITASALGWIAMLRNLTSSVAPIAALNNIALPIWMLTLGVALITAPVRLVAALLIAGLAAPGTLAAQTPVASDAPERIDYLTFAQGAVPISVGGAGAKLGADFERAVRITDGEPTAFSIVSGADAETATEFVYQLPALTTFDRFAVPNIVETPSPNVTFTRTVEVHGSTTSATDGFVLLASATLETHKTRGLVTDLRIAAKLPVRWIKVRLVGGINIMKPPSSFEFSEIVGNGTRERPELATNFGGVWRTQANTVQLVQKGPVVSGCYDRTGDLTGTVSGNILRATGIDRSDKTPSQFILNVAADGSLRGVRSSNRGPFRLYTVAAAPAGTKVECALPALPALGCGSVIHGITFGFDSAEIRPESDPVLAALFDGLRADKSATILIEGHTSSEGTDDYNQRLSERRAQAVVADLVRRGITQSRLSAAGIGERRPIATNNDESGRSLNRRVEVKCQ